jgi:hypothetical protein
VYDGEWFNTSNVVELLALNDLLNQLLDLAAIPEETGTPAVDETGTPLETGTPGTNQTAEPEATAVPEATVAPTAPSP